MTTYKFAQTVILGNGEFPTHEIPLQILKNATTIICCDGAANSLYKINVTPTIVIGDLDSISEDAKKAYKDICIHISEQDTNDQTKAVNWAISNGYSDVVILGSTGKREDHTLANIALLLEYSKKIKISGVTNTGVFTPIHKETNFSSYKGQQVSIFSIVPTSKISSQNLKYPLESLQLISWWMGTLNEALDNNFSIICENASILVYQAF